MTTADILTRVNAARACDDMPITARMELEKLATDLAAKIRKETAAERGCASAVTTLTRILKDAGKNRPQLGGAWLDKQGRQCTCNGYIAFRLKEAIPLPSIPEKTEPLDLAAVIDPVERRENIPVPTPDRQEVKAFITLEKAANGKKHTPVWDFGPGFPAVNAELLYDFLSVLPDAKLHAAATGKNRYFGPLYATSKLGDGVLLPVRASSKNAEYNRSEAISKALQEAECSAKKTQRENTLDLAAFGRIAAAMAS